MKNRTQMTQMQATQIFADFLKRLIVLTIHGMTLSHAMNNKIKL
jgi:hypothetical protein